MSLLNYFFSPTGRISRLEYWLGMLALLGVSMAISLLIDHSATEAGDPGLRGVAKAPMPTPTLTSTVWNLALTWPSAAIAIKRFNDRDWPHWLGYALGAAMAALVLANYNGLLLDPDRMSPAEKLTLVVLVIAFVWSMIDNGFKRGTAGPNQYGGDPLSFSQPDPA